MVGRRRVDAIQRINLDELKIDRRRRMETNNGVY